MLSVFGGDVGIEDDLAVGQPGAEFAEVVTCDLMRCDDEFPIAMVGKVRDVDLLVGLPTAACDEGRLVVDEGLDDGQVG